MLDKATALKIWENQDEFTIEEGQEMKKVLMAAFGDDLTQNGAYARGTHEFIDPAKFSDWLDKETQIGVEYKEIVFAFSRLVVEMISYFGRVTDNPKGTWMNIFSCIGQMLKEEATAYQNDCGQTNDRVH